MIRSPILVSLGHVDHGKTTLLDKIRGTAVAKSEPGLITQNISASYIPIEVIRALCTGLKTKLKLDLAIPGLLWIDSPGHEAFTTLRKRGGAIADLAVLVIDITEGMQPQTRESVMYLKQFKTPFVVALTKIDRLLGWQVEKDRNFLDTLEQQTERTKAELEEKLYSVVGQLSSDGISADRYDRVSDFTKQAAIVPLSSHSGEGIADLLMMLAGLAQRYLKEDLEITEGMGKGTILEVKEYRGLGTIMDVILYDGEIRRGDTLAVGGKEIVVTKVRALLRPQPLQELKGERGFASIESVGAAAGIKISAPNLENVIAGSPIRAIRNDKELEKAKSELQEEVEEVEFESSHDGVVLKADTLGGLEALVKIVRDKGIPIRNAHVGTISRSELMDVRSLPNPIVFAFNIPGPDDLAKLAKDTGIELFRSDIIYHILEAYEAWTEHRKKRQMQQTLADVTKPCRLRILRGYVFRQSNPAVCGVEILKGTLQCGVRLLKGKDIISEVREIQKDGKNVSEAVAGDKVAISLPEATIGKDIKENDVLEVFLTGEARETLERIKYQLRPDERELLEAE